jgi:hypothetical protein
MVTNANAKSAFSEYNNNIYNKNNLREYNIVHGESIQVGKHCYLVCIPDLPTVVTKMEVARAVERRILYSSTGEIQYVKNVVFIQGFDEESKNAIENSCYKIAIVNVEMTPNEHGVYTDYENDFYESVCRGDIVIGEWSNAFLMANPNYYFKSVEAAAATQAAQTEAAFQIDAAFQKWKHGVDIANYKRRVDEGETEILELQNTVNELVESLRFLSRKRSGEGLVGLKDASKSLSSFLSTLNNKYARICVSDVEFLEINKNMKLKKMLELVVNVCDDCDACQELIHSLDYIGHEERRRDLFVQIDKLICRINHSVRKFQLLHLYAERCIFGLKNRAVFTEFASFLNTAVEIVEEVTSRNCTHTQDVEYVKYYGIRATSKQEQEKQEAAAAAAAAAANDGSCVGDYYSGGCWDGSACASWDGSNGYDGVTVNNNHYDYYENADDVEEGDDADDDAGADEEMTSVSQMLAEFDAMRALTATTVVVEDTVKVQVEVEVDQQQQSEEVELVMTATAVKEEQKQQEEEKETKKETKGKWFSWF